MSTTQTHTFEERGLGKAPYTYRLTRSNGGTCAYCGMALKVAHHFLSADGKPFWVGSDCAEKSGDEGIVRKVEKAVKKIEADKKAAKAASVVEALKALDRDALAKLPHPAISSLTLADYVAWMLTRGGAAGKAKALKLAQAALKG